MTEGQKEQRQAVEELSAFDHKDFFLDLDGVRKLAAPFRLADDDIPWRNEEVDNENIWRSLHHIPDGAGGFVPTGTKVRGVVIGELVESVAQTVLQPWGPYRNFKTRKLLEEMADRLERDEVGL